MSDVVLVSDDSGKAVVAIPGGHAGRPLHAVGGCFGRFSPQLTTTQAMRGSQISTRPHTSRRLNRADPYISPRHADAIS